MTDRELLELAAKAAGYLDDQIYPSHDEGLVLFNKDQDQMTDGTYWNPLNDDGGALRLAVKLNLIVGAYGTYSSVGETYEKPKLYTDGDEFVCWHHETHNDTYAATRRAIVRAAAAIGKAMS